MNIEIPTKEQLLRFIKYSAYLAVPGLILAAWLVYKDPTRVLAEQHLLQSQEVAAVVGTITDISLTKATYAQEAISFSGERTPAYNVYRFSVSGTKNSGRASVLVEEPKTKNETFSVTIAR